MGNLFEDAKGIWDRAGGNITETLKDRAKREAEEAAKRKAAEETGVDRSTIEKGIRGAQDPAGAAQREAENELYKKRGEINKGIQEGLKGKGPATAPETQAAPPPKKDDGSMNDFLHRAIPGFGSKQSYDGPSTPSATAKPISYGVSGDDKPAVRNPFEPDGLVGEYDKALAAQEPLGSPKAAPDAAPQVIGSVPPVSKI